MKTFKLCGETVKFWTETGFLFCTHNDIVYCLGIHEMPETEKDAMNLINSAWIW